MKHYKKVLTAITAAVCVVISSVSVFAASAVYELLSGDYADYLLTISWDEMDVLDRAYDQGYGTYDYIGIKGYADTFSSSYTIPVYRFWNNKTLDHFYTTSEAEKQSTIDSYNSGRDDYQYEGLAWYWYYV